MTLPYGLKDVDTVARTVWGEARGEGPEGMRAVAWVVHNRWATQRRWPDTYGEVCTQPRQFSAWNKRDPNRVKMMKVDFADYAFRVAYGIAASVMASMEQDPTAGANHYHTDSLEKLPAWADPARVTVRIGHHVLYRL